MKFGGTSVATADSRQMMVEKVRESLRRGNMPVVVVSAMGRQPQPYATDSLLSLVSDFEAVTSAGEIDTLMACGETISSIVVSHTFRSEGWLSRSFDGRQAGILTTSDPGNGRIINIDPEPLMSFIHAGGIPVVTGFQGVDGHGETTTLGRGGSDTSAVALGAALRAHFVEIYTDVDGVMTCDPRVYTAAQILTQINFEEMGELASSGAKVVHPRAIELADNHGVPVWIKNTLRSGGGTFMARAVPDQAYESDRVVTGISHKYGMTGLVMEVSDRAHQVDVLRLFATAGLNLDLINVTPQRLYAILESSVFEKRGQKLLTELEIPYEKTDGCAKLSLVGAGMRGTPGVMAQVLDALHQVDVTVIHSTDSNITISLLVAESDVGKAVEALHRQFLSN